jgi:hypothetical protein
VSNSWLLSLSPGPENSQTDISVDGPTPQQKLLPTIFQEKGVPSGEAAHCSSKEQSQYPWQLPEQKSDYSPQCDIYIKPYTTQTESSSPCAARDQVFEAYLTPPMTPGSVTQKPTNYIIEATNHVGQAQLHEAKGEYDAAFALYKTGIACLLGGVQGMVLYCDDDKHFGSRLERKLMFSPPKAVICSDLLLSLLVSS